MTFPEYRRCDGDFRYPTPIPNGAAVPFSDGVVFKCPCGERQVFVASPPHTIEYSDDGLLTLNGSVGSREKLRLPSESPESDEWRNRPANWCHFWLRSGQVEMCGDAKCPGGSGEVL